MALIRPRLTDFHEILLPQEEVDFAIPFLDEDIPFCADPFLLWKSPSQQDNALHTALISSFNHIGVLVNSGNEAEAIGQLIRASECDEVGLGFSAKRKGVRIVMSTNNQKIQTNIVPRFRPATCVPRIEIMITI